MNQKFATLPYSFMAKSISKKGPQATTKKAPSKKAPSKKANGQSSKGSRKATTGKKRKELVSSDSEDSTEDTPQHHKKLKQTKMTHSEVSEVDVQGDISQEEITVEAEGIEHDSDKASCTHMKNNNT